jgi:long-chain acyl-CoA synthetase
VELSDFKASPNLVALFLHRADGRTDRPFLWSKRGGAWIAVSWRDTARQVCLLAQGLRRIGLNEGDRVLLVSENRCEWCIADLAIMAAGCIPVPAYTTNTERDHAHVLNDSGARAAIVSNEKLAGPLVSAMQYATDAELLVTMAPLGEQHTGRIRCHDWSALVAGDAHEAREGVEARIAGVGRGDLACIVYTSGSGGAPRGVKQHHGAILHNISGTARVIAEDFDWVRTADDSEVFLSFLPLSHAYEHTAGQFLPIGLGAQIYYAEGLERLSANIADVRPTIMIVVPRLFEVMRSRIIALIGGQGRIANLLLDRATSNAGRRAEGRTGLTDRLSELVIARLLRPKIRKRFGGRMKALVSGGAPLNPDVGHFFEAIGVTALQGYGQTEAGPVISVNRPGPTGTGIRMETVGPPLADTEVAIAPDGEILVRGELVMHGYWRNEAETARALEGGWLHTGDIGHLDEAGRIMITDRKKDMIVNDKGDNVSPQRIEGMLMLQPEIAQAMVIGDRRPYLVALLVPDTEWTVHWAQENGETFNLWRLQDLPAYRNAVREALDRVNAQLSVIEKVRQFVFADEPFSIENAELTPSMKIRRHKLLERYGAKLGALYKD